MLKSLEIKVLTAKNFEKYGRILIPTEEESKKGKNQPVFYLVLERAQSKGWMMAHFTVSKRFTDAVENHPNTKETFEPLSGVPILIVAANRSPESPEAFLLDKPVVLNEGIWHDVLSLSESATMRINENTEVQTVYHKLSFTVKAELNVEKL